MNLVSYPGKTLFAVISTNMKTPLDEMMAIEVQIFADYGVDLTPENIPAAQQEVNRQLILHGWNPDDYSYESTVVLVDRISNHSV